MKKSFNIIIIVLFLAGASLFLIMGRQKSETSSSTPSEKLATASTDKAVVYKTANCGCCRVYAKYLPKEGIETEYSDISQEELDQMRQKFGISDDMAACHITVIGDYFVSGHIPIEAITKLLAEKPDVAGIALAGMPSGTPGMPGPKYEQWVIYAIGADGSSAEFMTI